MWLELTEGNSFALGLGEPLIAIGVGKLAKGQGLGSKCLRGLGEQVGIFGLSLVWVGLVVIGLDNVSRVGRVKPFVGQCSNTVPKNRDHRRGSKILFTSKKKL